MNTQTIASPHCYACAGTGKVIGFGVHHGKSCPCIDHCEDCNAPIAWEHDDERAPRFCSECIDQDDTPTVPRIRLDHVAIGHAPTPVGGIEIAKAVQS